jgi:hypothetical protein
VQTSLDDSVLTGSVPVVVKNTVNDSSRKTVEESAGLTQTDDYELIQRFLYNEKGNEVP